MKQSLWSLAAAASFSIMAAFVKLCSDQLGPFELVFYRSLFGVGMMALFMAKTHKQFATKVWKLYLSRTICSFTAICLWFYTLGQMDFGTNMTLVYTTPLFMAGYFIVLSFRQHTRAPWGLIVPTLAGFLGVTIILQPSISAEQLIPALITLFTAFIDLIVYLQMKEMGNTKEPSWRIVFYFTLFSTVLAFFGVFIFDGGFHMPHGEALWGVLGMGVFATLGQVANTRSFAYGNLLLSSLLGFSAIPFSLIIGVALFADHISWTSLAGVSMIVIAGLFATVHTKRTEKALANAQKEAEKAAAQ